MSRTYRRRGSHLVRYHYTMITEDEYLAGGYVHGWSGGLEWIKDFKAYDRREKMLFISDKHIHMGSAPSWYCNVFNRAERYGVRKQLRNKLRFDWEDVDVQRVCGKRCATGFWW